MENRKSFDVKRLRKLIAQSSKEWFLQFFEDDTAQKQLYAENLEKLTIASQNKALVVLQVEKKGTPVTVQTLTGFLATKSFDKGTVVLRPLVATEAIQIIALKDIKKVAVQGINFPAQAK